MDPGWGPQTVDPSRAQFSASAVLALPHTGDMSPGGWPAWGFRRVCGRQVDVPWKHGVWYTYCMAYIITRGIAKLPCKHCDALSKWPPPRRCSRTPSPAKPAGAQEILRIFVAEFQKFLISKCPGQRRHQREREAFVPLHGHSCSKNPHSGASPPSFSKHPPPTWRCFCSH